MPFKTLLAITGTDMSNDDIKLAAGLCEETGIHLSALVLVLAAPPPVGEFAAVVSEAWMQERQEDMGRLRKRTKAVSEFLGSSSLSTDVTAEYPEQAWADDAIGRRARYADLTVIGPELLGRPTLRDKAIEGALFSSGKPLLLVPHGPPPTLKPKRVMIAWDAHVEAARAVREALEMIAGADEVRVVIVDPVESESGHGKEPGADISAYLARHGARVTVDRLPSEGHAVATMLRRHVDYCASDLLVMGGYGHSRLRERVFGGVTKSILADPPIPVLMAR